MEPTRYPKLKWPHHDPQSFDMNYTCFSKFWKRSNIDPSSWNRPHPISSLGMNQSSIPLVLMDPPRYPKLKWPHHDPQIFDMNHTCFPKFWKVTIIDPQSWNRYHFYILLGMDQYRSPKFKWTPPRYPMLKWLHLDPKVLNGPHFHPKIGKGHLSIHKVGIDHSLFPH